MRTKRFTITKKKFIDWLISDEDDYDYWSGRFIHELKEEGKLNVTIRQLFNERIDLPGHLFEDQMTLEEIEDDDLVNTEIDIHLITLKNK